MLLSRVPIRDSVKLRIFDLSLVEQVLAQMEQTKEKSNNRLSDWQYPLTNNKI